MKAFWDWLDQRTNCRALWRAVELEALAQEAVDEVYAAGESVVVEGDEGQLLFIIVSGEASVFGMPVAKFADSVPPTMTSSMHHDFERGNPLEVEWLSGGVVTLGAEAGVPTPLTARLVEMHQGIAEVIASLKPMALAIEQLYSHYERPRTAILMGHARGVICLAAALSAVPLSHYAATHVKRLLTVNAGFVGHGFPPPNSPHWLGIGPIV